MTKAATYVRVNGMTLTQANACHAWQRLRFSVGNVGKHARGRDGDALIMTEPCWRKRRVTEACRTLPNPRTFLRTHRLPTHCIRVEYMSRHPMPDVYFVVKELLRWMPPSRKK